MCYDTVDRRRRSELHTKVRILLRLFLTMNLTIYHFDSAFTIVSPGISSSVQSMPIRTVGVGVPPSGPMDPIAFQAGNILVDNPVETEGIELVVPPRAPSLTKALAFIAHFHVNSVVAVTGAAATVTVDGQEKSTWTAFSVPANSKLVINGALGDSCPGGGLRAYLSIQGGLPGIPEYLGSKSTSMGFGGYQVRPIFHSLCSKSLIEMV